MKRGRKPLPPAQRQANRIAATRRASAKWNRAHQHEIRDRRAERNFRNRNRSGKPAEPQLEKLRRVDLTAPRYRWIDRHGRIHEELWESPEQLLARLRKEGQL
jgi:hypothetical protein